jgi:hypothetical protein
VVYNELVVLLAALLRDAPTALHSLLCMQEKTIEHHRAGLVVHTVIRTYNILYIHYNYSPGQR